MTEKYNMINLEDYIQSGEGGTALTYNNKDGKTLAKLFMPGMATETAQREFLVNVIVYDLGLPTPKPIRLITDGTRYGAEYELIPGKRSFTRIISQEPEKLEPLSVLFAKLAKELHTTQADTSRLPAMKDLVRDKIISYKLLPEDIRERALAALDNVPDATTCLHGDLHIGNIITDGNRNLWIDVGDFAYGVPEWDLSMLYYATNNISKERAESIFHLNTEVLKEHWRIFAKTYYGTDDETQLKKKEESLHHYFAMKIIFIISKLGFGVNPPSEGIQALMRRYLGI